ncbi:MAG: hypothetical protein ACFBZ9_04960 [Sphingomonadales bacterium]
MRNQNSNNLAGFHTELENGYYSAFEIMTYCAKHGHEITMRGKKLVYDRKAVPRRLRNMIKAHAEHIKLFILNNGAPPPGVALLSRSAATARGREYAGKHKANK